jgi:hypothetical protein
MSTANIITIVLVGIGALALIIFFDMEKSKR